MSGRHRSLLVLLVLSFFQTGILRADVSLQGLTGLIETPSAFVAGALAYQLVEDQSETVYIQPLFGNVAEGGLFKRLSGDKKSFYSAKMRLCNEGIFFPALAGGFFDINENTGKRRPFFVASKRFTSISFLGSVGAQRNPVTEKNEFFAGFEKSLYGPLVIQAEYLAENKDYNAAVKFEPFSGVAIKASFLGLKSGDSATAYSVFFEKGF